MRRHRYEKLEVYQRSLRLSVRIIQICEDIRPYRLSEQLAGSSISIPSNIAEGSDRDSNLEFKRFLRYAAGSAAELTTQLKIVELADKHEAIETRQLIEESKEINAMIHGLMNNLTAD